MAGLKEIYINLYEHNVTSFKDSEGRFVGYGTIEGDITNLTNLRFNEYNRLNDLSVSVDGSKGVAFVAGGGNDEIRLGAPLATDENILKALTMTGALKFVQEKKEGLDHLILEGGVGFSGGQKQALLLARLLIREPNILLLDEPTAAIDDVAEKELIEQLKGWLDTRTLIIATHRRAVLELVDRIIVLDDGKIIRDIPRQQIVKQQHSHIQHASIAGEQA
ncbi:MAG: ATP-binding cassette domain-containing protein [Bacteroidales bacterium]|nr:ATP-binding cassette domain-containing protein [Bacteroidales bacterium]